MKGEPMRNRKSSILATTLALGLGVTLAACGGDSG